MPAHSTRFGRDGKYGGARLASPVRRRRVTLAGGWGRPRLAWAHPTGGRRRCRSAGARDHGERPPAWPNVGLARGRLVRRGATRRGPCRRRDASCLPAAAVAAPAGAMALVGFVARLYLARDDLASPRHIGTILRWAALSRWLPLLASRTLGCEFLRIPPICPLTRLRISWSAPLAPLKTWREGVSSTHCPGDA